MPLFIFMHHFMGLAIYDYFAWVSHKTWFLQINTVHAKTKFAILYVCNDIRAIAHTCAITHASKEKEGLGRQWKACPQLKLHELISPEFILTDTIEFILNWFFYPYLLCLYLRQILTAATFCYLIYFQPLCNGVSDIFNKSAFVNRKLVVII